MKDRRPISHYVRGRVETPASLYCNRCARYLTSAEVVEVEESIAYGCPAEEAIRLTHGCPRYDANGEALGSDPA